MRPPVLTSAVLAVAVLFSFLPLNIFFTSSAIFPPGFIFLLIAGALGSAGAALRIGSQVIFSIQLAILTGGVLYSSWALKPEEGFFFSWLAVTGEAINQIVSGQLPLAMTQEILFLCLLAAASLLLFAELLTNILEQPTWSFAPLSLPFVVATIISESPVLTILMAVPAAGFVAVLASTYSISHPVGLTPIRMLGQGLRVVLAALLLAIPAFILATQISPFIPVNSAQPLSASSARSIQLQDPTVALNENLRRPTATPVLNYRSSTGKPVYLRTVGLPDLTTDGVRLVPMKLRSTGLSAAYDFPGDPVSVEVEMSNFNSEYLPVPFAAESFEAAGSWSFDPITLSIIASSPAGSAQTLGLAYTATGIAPPNDAETLADVMAGTPPDQITQLIPDVSPEVRQLTSEVVTGATSDGDKALRIEAFLRGQNFTYTLDAPTYTSLDTISAFLLENRAGYCIHFASGMMTMARIAGIPARMAVGFNGGTPDGEGGFEVTTHNMHAWPELFFEGRGWVPFEPTPAQGSGASDRDSTGSPSDAPNSEAAPSPSASAAATPSPAAAPSPSPNSTGGQEEETAAQGTFGWLGWMLAILFSGLAILSLPRIIRFILASWRLRPGQSSRDLAANAWREVRASYADIGILLPKGTPGPAVSGTAKRQPGRADLERVAGIVQRTYFARPGEQSSQLPALVRGLRKELIGSAPTLSRWLPRSLWRY